MARVRKKRSRRQTKNGYATSPNMFTRLTKILQSLCIAPAIGEACVSIMSWKSMLSTRDLLHKERVYFAVVFGVVGIFVILCEIELPQVNIILKCQITSRWCVQYVHTVPDYIPAGPDERISTCFLFKQSCA
jgi:hypothetical protein